MGGAGGYFPNHANPPGLSLRSRSFAGALREWLARSRAIAVAPAFLLAACGDADRPRLPSPELVQLDSVLLAETDSMYVGQASALVAAGDGTYLIADLRTSTIHHYAPVRCCDDRDIESSRSAR